MSVQDAQGVHYWSVRVNFYNKIKKKRVIGLAKIYIQGVDRFRIEIMDSFGFVRIGTIIVNESQAKMNFVNQSPYEGPVYDGMFKKMLKANVSIRDFISLFTQSNISESEWSCKNNSEGVPVVCANTVEGLLIKWSGSMKERNVNCKVKHLRADMDLRVKSYKHYKEYKDSLFNL